MRQLGCALTLLLCLLALTVPARAQKPKTVTREVVVGSARVDRIDRFSRSLTLRTKEGLVQTVYVEPELKVFDEVRSGDTVTVRVVESVVVDVRPDARPTIVTDTTAAAKKEAGGTADVLQQLKATVTVESIDAANQVIVYTMADRRQAMRQVADPRLLEGLKKGDVIEVTYTRERAIALTKH
jgi:ABC-type uncharacterized transport system ATPase subunit